MHEVRAAIVADTIRKHPFRQPAPDEDVQMYFEALLAHVEHVVDISTRFELQFDRRQKDWTPDQVQQFIRETKAMGGPATTLSPGAHAYRFVKTDGHPATDAELLRLAAKGLANTVRMRQAEPTRELAVMLSVLRLDGEYWTTTVSSDDRLALIHYLAQTEPVFGFILTADSWLHDINVKTQKAQRRECILQHVGSRDLRRVYVRPYATDNGRTVFSEGMDLDTRDDLLEVSDPYAAVFVTVPVSTGKPS